MPLTNWCVRISFSVLIYGNEVCPLCDPHLSTHGGKRHEEGEERETLKKHIFSFIRGRRVVGRGRLRQSGREMETLRARLYQSEFPSKAKR